MTPFSGIVRFAHPSRPSGRIASRPLLFLSWVCCLEAVKFYCGLQKMAGGGNWFSPSLWNEGGGLFSCFWPASLGHTTSEPFDGLLCHGPWLTPPTLLVIPASRAWSRGEGEGRNRVTHVNRVHGNSGVAYAKHVMP